MNVGYAYWGYLGDYKYDFDEKPVTTPDGNAFYSWSIIKALQDRGDTVTALMPDRDAPGYFVHGEELFAAFSKDKRHEAYLNLGGARSPKENTADKIQWTVPYLDVILLEWRFPTYKGYTADLMWQTTILNAAKEHGIPVIVFDLDHKLTEEDERKWKFEQVLETSIQPKEQYCPRNSVGIPFDMDELIQFPMSAVDSRTPKVVYVGNRYERDESIDKYVYPLVHNNDIDVEFYGNWTDPKYMDCQERWPQIKFNGRINQSQFRDVLKTATCTPLLAKKSYYETGFFTARVLEAFLYGTLPVGFGEHLGVELVLPKELIVYNAAQFQTLLYDGALERWHNRNDFRNKFIDQSRHWFDSKEFVQNVFGPVS